MGNSCELCHLEITNETYVVHPVEDSFEDKFYHYVCFLIIGDDDNNGYNEEEELYLEPLPDLSSSGTHLGVEFTSSPWDQSKNSPSAA